MRKGLALRRCLLAMVVAGGVMCGGCKQQASAAPDESGSRRPLSAEESPSNHPVRGDEVVARVGGHVITLSQLQTPLIEAYGLNILLNLVQLELAKDQSERAGAVASTQDIDAERQLTLQRLFPDADKEEYEALFNQFLQQQRISA